jgi:magnesium-transporting ATPase (P-type)
MVLTDDNFASIVAAIEEGRAIYDNIKKFIKYLLSSNVGEILVMFVALLVGMPVPLLAIQILWINLVTDGLPAIALGFEPAEEGVMRRKPRHKNESIFAGGVGRHIIIIGILIAILTLGGYIWGFNRLGLNAFNPEAGLSQMASAEIIELTRETGVAEDEVFGSEDFPITAEQWDAASEIERIDWLENPHTLETAEGESAPLEGASAGLIGLVERIPRSIAFTILAFTQMFEVMAIHAGDNSPFFRTGFKGNRLLLWAVLSTFALQLIVLYVPFMQSSFETAGLSPFEMLVSCILGSTILFAVEIEKYVNRNFMQADEMVQNPESVQI